MPIKLLMKIYDTMVVPILLYGAEVWAASGKFIPDNWDKTAIEKQHTSLLKQIRGVNRSTQNIAIRAEFWRLPLLLNSQAREWNYIKYIRKKPDSCVKEAYKIDSDLDTKNAHFKEIELGIKQLIVENVKKTGPLQCGEKRVNSFLKMTMSSSGKKKIRNSPTPASYATHKTDYGMEDYLTHVPIKKHRNALAKLRLSDHLLHIQTGRQTRPTNLEN